MSNGDKVTAKKYTILVADDDEGVIRLIVNLLSQRGHRCLQAADGVDALNKAATTKVDAVVTDIVMPKMDGVTLTRRLLEQTRKLPVMVMTGHDNEFSAVQAIAAGAREFIKKPFSLKEFFLRFHKMMHDHEVSLETEARQREMLFQSQKESSEKMDEFKREIDVLRSRLYGRSSPFGDEDEWS